MANILVTGGSGFIGSHLVEALISCGNHVTVIDNLLTGNRANLENFIIDKQINFIAGDICDKDLLAKIMIGIDIVYHLAARISVVESIKHPDLYTETNLLGTFNVLEACYQHQVKHVVLASSAAVYGNQTSSPITETMLMDPQSPYALTKADSEYYFNFYQQKFGLQTTQLRYFNVFGPRQHPQSAYAAAIPTFIAQALKNADITIYGNGEQTRDFIFVKDVVQANLLAVDGPSGTYNVAYGESLSINQLVKMIIELTESTSKIIYAAPRKNEVLNSQADISKLKQELLFKPSYNIIEGLRITVDEVKKYLYA